MKVANHYDPVSTMNPCIPSLNQHAGFSAFRGEEVEYKCIHAPYTHNGYFLYDSTHLHTFMQGPED